MAAVFTEGLNNKKRGDSYAISELYATVGEFDVVKLPKEVIVIEAMLNVTVADSAAGATMDILVDGNVLADEIKVDVTGVNDGTFVKTYLQTGGTITVKTGGTAGNGDGKQQLVLRYVEITKTTGEYTEV